MPVSIRRLLTLGHSYVVGLNRRLAHELARAGAPRWEVVVAAPRFFHGDMQAIPLEPLPDEPCRLEALPAHFTGRIHIMLYGRRLRALLREPWDLVHCWEEPFVLAGGQVARWTPPGAALVYATFQNIAKSYPPPFCWIERWALRRATAWIAFGKLVEQTLASRPGYRDRPHVVIPTGVDVERFRPDPERRAATLQALGWSAGGPPVVGFLGRLVPEKGLVHLIDVLQKLDTPWRALIVGSGPLEGMLRAWAASQDNRVRVVTGVSHVQVPAYLNAMEVLCAPSQTTPRWREQLGRMLLEAFASGVPVLASNSGEIPHVVGDAGIVVPEQHPEVWRQRLGELLESPARRLELAARGRDRAQRCFAWPVVARQHLEFFERVLEK